jgi:hypothetical protein
VISLQGFQDISANQVLLLPQECAPPSWLQSHLEIMQGQEFLKARDHLLLVKIYLVVVDHVIGVVAEG